MSVSKQAQQSMMTQVTVFLNQLLTLVLPLQYMDHLGRGDVAEKLFQRASREIRTHTVQIRVNIALTGAIALRLH